MTITAVNVLVFEATRNWSSGPGVRSVPTSAVPIPSLHSSSARRQTAANTPGTRPSRCLSKVVVWRTRRVSARSEVTVGTVRRRSARPEARLELAPVCQPAFGEAIHLRVEEGEELLHQPESVTRGCLRAQPVEGAAEGGQHRPVGLVLAHHRAEPGVVVDDVDVLARAAFPLPPQEADL